MFKFTAFQVVNFQISELYYFPTMRGKCVPNIFDFWDCEIPQHNMLIRWLGMRSRMFWNNYTEPQSRILVLGILDISPNNKILLKNYLKTHDSTEMILSDIWINPWINYLIINQIKQLIHRKRQTIIQQVQQTCKNMPENGRRATKEKWATWSNSDQGSGQACLAGFSGLLKLLKFFKLCFYLDRWPGGG